MGSSHHSDGPRLDSETAQRILGAREQDREAFTQRWTPEITLGKQRDFPAGSYGPDDEGSLAFAVGHDTRNCRVVVDFGSAVHWLALEPEQALQLAQLLVNHAVACSGSQKRLAAAVREAIRSGDHPATVGG